jgi:hypothetical protein
MDKKKTLNEILSNYQSLEMELIDNEGEITGNIEEKLLINDLDLNQKLNGYEKFVRYLKHQSEYLKSMENHYNKRRKVIENSILKCKSSMINAMKMTNQDKIKTEDFNFSIGKSKKWSLDESNLTEDLKYDLIKNGLAENNFKPFISEIKNKYKGKEIPAWVEIIENEFLRVN